MVDPVHGSRASVQDSRPVHARRPRPSRWRWRVPKEDLKRLLAEGLGVSEIARRFNISHSIVSRAVRALDHQDLVSAILGDRCQPKLPEIPPPSLDAPVDVMGEVMSVIEDIRHLRAWLASDEARARPQDSGPPQRPDGALRQAAAVGRDVHHHPL